MKSACLIGSVFVVFAMPFSAHVDDGIDLLLRSQIETGPSSGKYHKIQKREKWNPKQTAVIVCDVWDLHHSLNAVRRVEEFVPRLDELLKQCRKQGMTIVHSPSDCMDAYQSHPARRRAINVPESSRLPYDIKSWCSRIPHEEKAVYPLDQSDGGDDDDPAEHADWAAELKKMGRNSGMPWKKQSDLIAIDLERDYISDRGDEVWNILNHRGIENVILTGVHTNMCVIGRPFGLRQMARNGKKVVLVRDMTDTMYNPARWPYVSHFTGTDLIVSHIEKYVCPTITSDQILGGLEFRFKHDTRPHVAIVTAESLYKTDDTFPEFASSYLGKHFRVSLLFASDKDKNVIPGLEILDKADLAIFSVRRRTLSQEQLGIVKRFVASGKPVIGIRTASHAFSLRQSPPKGFAAWPEFDADVFGGNYSGHHPNGLKSIVSVSPDNARHPILQGVSASFSQGGSLYQPSPLNEKAVLLLSGTIEDRKPEPVAWTFRRSDGGRSFYTSLGAPEDFQNPNFVRLMVNAIHWAVQTVSPAIVAATRRQGDFEKHWSLMPVPSSWGNVSSRFKDYRGDAWYRCSIRLPDRWLDPSGLMLKLPESDAKTQAWLNGHLLTRKTNNTFAVQNDWIEVNDANLLVINLGEGTGDRGWRMSPTVVSGQEHLDLKGRWQFRIGHDPTWSNIPLPARYGTSTDIVFEPKVPAARQAVH